MTVKSFKEKVELNYQQFMVAFAIPPRVCKKPGPETTRHTPGLDRKIKKKEKRKVSTVNIQLITNKN